MTRLDAQPTAANSSPSHATPRAPDAPAGTSSAFMRVARYFHDCFAADARGGILKDIFEQTDYRVFSEGVEQLVTGTEARMAVPVKVGIEAQNAAEINRRERFLIYGSVFLVGKGQARGRNAGEKFCAPLLYYPARVEIEGGKAFVSAALDEQHVNFPLLSTFIDAESDEQAQAYAEAILAQVPTAPLADDALRELAGLVGELLPDLDTEALRSFPNLITEDQLRAAANGPMRLVCASAMMLAARPQEAKGVLTELQTLGQDGASSTPLAGIFDPDSLPASAYADPTADTEPVFAAAELSLAQQNVIRHARTRPLTLVIGPPGTGKSFTTAQLVLDAVARGQTVLITSKMNKAVDVVIEKLQPHLGSQTFILRGGDRSHREEMRGWLNGLLTNTGPQGMPQAARPGEVAMLEDRLRDADAELDRVRREIIAVLNLEQDWTGNHARFAEIQAPIHAGLAAEEIGPDEILRRYDEAKKLEASNAPLVGWAMQRRGQSQMTALCAQLDLPEDQREIIPTIVERERERIQLRATTRALEGHGDLNALFTAYARVRDDRGKLVAELLAVRRRDALAQALRNDRRSLTAFNTALNAKSDAAQEAIFREMDFRALLRTFPIWAVTNQHVAEFLPLVKEMFDLVVIDEASQCDIASALPLLYRGHHAVVCGDPMQLRHLSWLREDRQRGIAAQHGLSAIEREQWNYRTHSLLDAVNQALPTQDDVILLDEHYRCQPQIIEFSNRQFYGGGLRIMTRRPDTIGKRSLELKKVKGVRRKEGFNSEEADAIVKEIERIAKEESKRAPRDKSSIGVLSPYTDQVKYLNKQLQQMKHRIVQDHQVAIGTAHTFQGDERDIMLISLAADPTSHYATLTYLNQNNLFNVAITRARQRQVIYTSLDMKGLQRDHLVTKFLQYAQDCLEDTATTSEPNRTGFVGELAEALQGQGYTAWFDYPVAGFEVPLVASYQTNTSIAIECDGIPTTRQLPDGIDPVARQAILERAGWTVHRLSYRRWVEDRAGCLAEIGMMLGSGDEE